MGLAVGKLTQFVAGSGQTHRLSHTGPVLGGKVGWLTGFEPATARSTIWGSNHAELQPPPACEASQALCERQREMSRVHTHSLAAACRGQASRHLHAGENINVFTPGRADH
jgi:hypothetical protein